MARSELTVGSLRGVPQWGGGPAGTSAKGATVGGRLRPPEPSDAQVRSALPSPAPVKLGRGCCRSMCAGCPWAEGIRQSLGQSR